MRFYLFREKTYVPKTRGVFLDKEKLNILKLFLLLFSQFLMPIEIRNKEMLNYKFYVPYKTCKQTQQLH